MFKKKKKKDEFILQSNALSVAVATCSEMLALERCVCLISIDSALEEYCD